MGRQQVPASPPPPPPPSPTPTRVDTSGQQRIAEKAIKGTKGSASTILTKRKSKISKLGTNTKGATNILGQGGSQGSM